MSITIEAYEDSGMLTSNRGSIIQLVENIGHKSTSNDESFHFSYYPILRPSPHSSNENDLYGVSFHKYTHFKISGTYASATRVRIKMEVIEPEGDEANLVYTKTGNRVVYKWTNHYQTPTENLLSGSTWDMESPKILVPCLSTSSPDTATDFVHILQPNTTYYTNFLVTQIHLNKGILENLGEIPSLLELYKDDKTTLLDFGNIPLIKVTVTLDEYETDVTNDYNVGC